MALAGVASRRACDEIIKAGRVRIDGKPVESPGQQIHPKRNKVTVDGRVISAVTTVIYALNKPRGVVSTAKDPNDNVTVLDLAGKAGVEERVYPVGRLDKDSRGLMLLTNDGDLAYRLTHPRYGVEKIYRVRLNLPITKTQMRRFATGLELTDGRTAPCHISELRGRATYRIILKEGRKRQIRRMFEELKRRVLDLERVKIGPLPLGKLQEGKLRELTEHEAMSLKMAVGLR